MTTGKAIHHRDPAAFKAELLTSPVVQAKAEAAAKAVLENMQTVQPEGAMDPTVPGVEKVFQRESSTMADGRPVEWIFINHPYAASFQATTGFITKSVSAAGLKMSNH